MRVPKLDYNSLKIFVASARHGNFTLAAKTLGIPLPTVSRRMLELEQQLKTQLFDRTTRGCTLTDAGAQWLEKVGPGIEILNEAESAVQRDDAQLTGRLRLSLPQSFLPWWELLGQFQKIHPGIKVSVHSTERRLDLLDDGIDVALRVGAISHQSVVARYLCDFRHVLVASPDFLNDSARITQPSDIAQLPCAAWGSTIDEQPVWRLGASPVNVDARLVVNDYLQLRDRALASDFLSELPCFLAAEYLKDGRLVEVLPEYPFARSQLHLVYRRLRHPSALIRAYVEFCCAQLPQLLEHWDVPLAEADKR